MRPDTISIDVDNDDDVSVTPRQDGSLQINVVTRRGSLFLWFPPSHAPGLRRQIAAAVLGAEVTP